MMSLKELREKAGLNPVEAAAKVGCHQASIGAWERGDYKPSPKHLPQVAQVYGVTEAEILLIFAQRPPRPPGRALVPTGKKASPARREGRQRASDTSQALTVLRDRPGAGGAPAELTVHVDPDGTHRMVASWRADTPQGQRLTRLATGMLSSLD